MWNPNSNLFSKIIIAISAIALGIALLCIGGTMAGWDIIGALTSDTAMLVYATILLTALMYLAYLCTTKFK